MSYVVRATGKSPHVPTYTEFTPFASAAGGVLIGCAAVLLMLTTGRIAGISGILSRLLMPGSESKPVQALAFVVGLIASPAIWMAIFGKSVTQVVTDNLPLAAIAGLLVGFGAVYGGGCTSGHGVCGLSRLSRRSFVATGVFMASAMLIVFIARHVIGAAS
jgi:uncharacterized membrane protein YedE/YeeE